MSNLIIKGKQNFMGLEIPVMYGGFGSNQRCLADKTIAEIHKITPSNVRKAIGRNFSRFKDGIDSIDLKSSSSGDDLLISLGYSTQQVLQAEHIYILSERGYAKLIKIMDTDLAWEIHDKLIDEYFEMRQEKEQPQAARAPNRADQIDRANKAAELVSATLTTGALPKRDICEAVLRIYRDELGIDLLDILARSNPPVPEPKIPFIPIKPAKPEPQIPIDNTPPKYESCYDIAKQAGMYSENGKPHKAAAGAIIRKLNVPDSMKEFSTVKRDSGTYVKTQYHLCVLPLVLQWLKDNNCPSVITSHAVNGKTRELKVYYKG